MEQHDLIDRMAQLVAQRAQRKLGVKAKLRLVGAPDERASENAAMRAWNAYEGVAESLATPALDTAPRAVTSRAILRIAQTYQWQSAIAHFLDTKGVGYMSELTDPQLDDLHDRMLGYLDAAMTGCDVGECLPAG